MGAIHGVDTNKTLIPLLVDATGKAIVTSPAMNSIIINSVISKEFSKLNCAAGTNWLEGDIVPANKILRVTYVSLKYIGTVAGITIGFGIYDGVTRLGYTFTSPVVSGVNYGYLADLYIDTGWYPTSVVTGATLNDDFYFRYNGYYISKV